MELSIFLDLITSDSTVCLLSDDDCFIFGFRKCDVNTLEAYLGLDIFNSGHINEINLGHHNHFDSYIDSFDYVLDIDF